MRVVVNDVSPRDVTKMAESDRFHEKPLAYLTGKLLILRKAL